MGRKIVEPLYELIEERKKKEIEGSYTCLLFSKGKDEILKKVGEEAVEVIVASKGDDKRHTINELADLAYHLLVLMVAEGITLDDIYQELEARYIERRENPETRK